MQNSNLIGRREFLLAASAALGLGGCASNKETAEVKILSLENEIEVKPYDNSAPQKGRFFVEYKDKFYFLGTTDLAESGDNTYKVFAREREVPTEDRVYLFQIFALLNPDSVSKPGSIESLKGLYASEPTISGGRDYYMPYNITSIGNKTIASLQDIVTLSQKQ